MGERSARSVVTTGDACPSDDLIAAYIAGDLDNDERDQIRKHIDTCDSCRAIVIHTQALGVLQTDKEALAATQPALDDHAVTEPDGAKSPASILKGTGLPTEVFAGRYQIQRLLGTGGMGTVYEALDLSLHRLVALKVLRLAPDKPTEHAEAVNRLIREARAMAILSHRNVVAVYDVGPHGDQVFVAMQLVDGLTLRAWLAAESRTTGQILKVLHDAGSGLEAAHAARLIHRDFKPDNVLVSGHGTARVTDFGLARRTDLRSEPASTSTSRTSAPRVLELDDSMTVTRSGAIVGTPAYMAPEQAVGDGWDARVDQFSFCVTAWEALCGNRPYAGDTWSKIHTNMINGRIEPPPADSQIPRCVQRALRRGLAADPDQRFPSMVALLEVLASAIQIPLRIWRIRLAATGVVVAGAALAIWQLQPSNVSTPPAPAMSTAAPARPADAPASAPAAMLPEPLPPIAATPQKPKQSTPRVAVTTRPAPAPVVEPSRVGNPRLARLAGARRALDQEWSKRDLLASDLPAAFITAATAADVALASNDAATAAAALERARAALAEVVIDRTFVDQKLQRLNARIERLPAGREQEHKDLLREVVTLFHRGDYSGANRKLNQIAARLGIGA